ncbi:OmpA family protein [Shinella zoogloeoides]|uniref:OmpA family protein n=1 Tax=Shinella zoogloeoides TaxID=352475 RepID=UPI00299DF3E6|nr:OmpA family protein [Shinella zoogloeoides]WPE20462.1 Peptidoglycan-associated lipoprotein [Shinella zoogloeoides]
MTFRSRLFATVALPLLSASLIATPSLADALSKPFEVAQESSDEGQPSEDELLLKQQQEEQRQAEEQQRQAEEQQRQAEEQQKAAEDQQRAAEQEAQRQAEEQKAAEESAQPAAEEEQPRTQKERKGKKRHQQEQQSEEQQPAEEQNAVGEDTQRQAEDQQRAAEESAQPAEEEQQRPKKERKGKKHQQQQEQQQTEEQQPAEEQNADTPRQAEEQKAGEESAQPAEEQQPSQKERKGKKRHQQEQQQTEGQQPTEEQPAMTGEGTPAETEGQPSTAEQPMDAEQQPATAEGGEASGEKKAPAVVETLSEEQKQEIAADPSKTDETVVLPVENGAAVLDSDKDADNAGGQKSRDQRRKKREELRAEEEAAPMPESDVSAQAPISDEVREALPQRIDAAIKEKGERLDAAPVFEVPQTTNVINNTVINNTVVNNTVNNNTVNNNVTHVNVVEKVDNRMVLSIGNQLVVRGDDRERLRHDSEEVYYDNLARGRVRETIVRPGGVRLVTIYNRYGDIIQRSRIGRDGDEHILVYAPDLGDDAPRPDFVDVGYELPPMRLRIPVRDYIIDTSSDPDRDYYDFLAEPPVERVERVYTIDEVKHSARLRDKVRRIDLDTITFATGSAEVPMSQARTLRKVADAMQKVLDKDAGETFLIEGHTDAVGSDKSNLILSDERAESVASLLTDVYGIPPENLQTQGYGERFLKVRTQSAEQQNRRVTIRRVTTLVRPVAQN